MKRLLLLFAALLFASPGNKVEDNAMARRLTLLCLLMALVLTISAPANAADCYLSGTGEITSETTVSGLTITGCGAIAAGDVIHVGNGSNEVQLITVSGTPASLTTDAGFTLTAHDGSESAVVQWSDDDGSMEERIATALNAMDIYSPNGVVVKKGAANTWNVEFQQTSLSAIEVSEIGISACATGLTCTVTEPTAHVATTLTGTVTLEDSSAAYTQTGAGGIVCHPGSTLTMQVDSTYPSSEDALVVTLGTGGLVKHPGCTLVVQGAFREFDSATPTLTSTMNAGSLLPLGRVVPCGLAAAASGGAAAVVGDCGAANATESIAFVYDTSEFNDTDGLRLAQGIDDMDDSTRNDVFCAWAYDPEGDDLSRDFPYCYYVSDVKASGVRAFQIDVDQGTKNSTYPLANRRIKQATLAANVAKGERSLTITDATGFANVTGLGSAADIAQCGGAPGCILDIDHQLIGRRVRFESGTNDVPEPISYLIRDVVDGAGSPDTILIAELDGFGAAKDSTVAGTNEIWIDYGYEGGHDVGFVMVPVIFRCASATLGACAITLAGQSSLTLSQVVFDGTGYTLLKSPTDLSSSHVWFRDVSPATDASLKVEVIRGQDVTLTHWITTGGNASTDIGDRAHFFRAMSTKSFTGQYLASRHGGDDDFFALLYGNENLRFHRNRSEWKSAASQSGGIHDFQDAQIDGLTVDGVYCAACTDYVGNGAQSAIYMPTQTPILTLSITGSTVTIVTPSSSANWHDEWILPGMKVWIRATSGGLNNGDYTVTGVTYNVLTVAETFPATEVATAGVTLDVHNNITRPSVSDLTVIGSPAGCGSAQEEWDSCGEVSNLLAINADSPPLRLNRFVYRDFDGDGVWGSVKQITSKYVGATVKNGYFLNIEETSAVFSDYRGPLDILNVGFYGMTHDSAVNCAATSCIWVRINNTEGDRVRITQVDGAYKYSQRANGKMTEILFGSNDAATGADIELDKILVSGFAMNLGKPLNIGWTAATLDHYCVFDTVYANGVDAAFLATATTTLLDVPPGFRNAELDDYSLVDSSPAAAKGCGTSHPGIDKVLFGNAITGLPQEQMGGAQGGGGSGSCPWPGCPWPQ